MKCSFCDEQSEHAILTRLGDPTDGSQQDRSHQQIIRFCRGHWNQFVLPVLRKAVR